MKFKNTKNILALAGALTFGGLVTDATAQKKEPRIITAADSCDCVITLSEAQAYVNEHYANTMVLANVTECAAKLQHFIDVDGNRIAALARYNETLKEASKFFTKNIGLLRKIEKIDPSERSEEQNKLVQIGLNYDSTLNAQSEDIYVLDYKKSSLKLVIRDLKKAPEFSPKDFKTFLETFKAEDAAKRQKMEQKGLQTPGL